jgi:hypothetical protein
VQASTRSLRPFRELLFEHDHVPRLTPCDRFPSTEVHSFAAQLDGQKPDRHRPFMAGMLAPTNDDVSSIDVVAARHRFVFYGNLPNTLILVEGY